MVVLFCFQRDLRLADSPALTAAMATGAAVVPIYIDSSGSGAAGIGDKGIPGGAAKWWLHHSLAALSAELEANGSQLVLRRGPTLRVLRELVKETAATAVYWHRRYEPAARAEDAALTQALTKSGVEAFCLAGQLLYEPDSVATKQGTPYKVFTPYWRACQSLPPVGKPLPAPKELRAPPTWPKSLALAELKLLPKIRWDSGFSARWTPGEKGAQKQLRLFGRGAVQQYLATRNLPATAGTSSLSAHLAFGEISARQIWHYLRTTGGVEKAAIKPGPVATKGEPEAQDAVAAYLRQLGWREFAYHLLAHFPATVTEPLRPEFAAFPWVDKPEWLHLWQRGLTGFPIVDAGMRELWHTGWMHNRVRMIVGSFLVKDLLQPWQEGAKWFWDTLVDADLANNTLGWQWIGGCGADAAPYFRVYNPVGQGERFDPAGDYIRRWVPELKALPDAWIHQPFAAPAAVLDAAKVKLGKTYPEPVVDHGKARFRALHAYAQIKRQKAAAAAP